jgi:hypothetical protein
VASPEKCAEKQKCRSPDQSGFLKNLEVECLG